jgi:ubiquinone/menaquinone biosynthesis C-methylase UbiE
LSPAISQYFVEENMSSIGYHLSELEIAKSPNDPRCILPEILEKETRILDIGCGIGQSFVSLALNGRTCVGLDIDEEALKYGIQNFGADVFFVLAAAEKIPFPSQSFDLVFSRVSLPYSNIPKALREIRRVLRKGGRVWMTLHGRDMAKHYLAEAIAARDAKRLIHVLYIILNGYLLKQFGFVVPFLTGQYESWQEPKSMVRMLSENGFAAQIRREGHHFVVEGVL